MADETSVETHEDDHVRPDVAIKIALPLPMDVAGALMEMIGERWPSAKVSGNGDEFMIITVSPDEATVDPDGWDDEFVAGL
jgi:hypothetical protein